MLHRHEAYTTTYAAEDGSRALSEDIRGEYQSSGCVDVPHTPAGVGDLLEGKPQHSQDRESETHFLCVSIPAVENIAGCDTLGIPVSLKDLEISSGRLNKFITCNQIEQLEAELGLLFLSRLKQEPVIHQAVMTMLMINIHDHASAEFKTWDWLRDQITHNKLQEHVQSIQSGGLMVLVSCTNCIWPGLSLRNFYAQTSAIAAGHGKTVFCPSETEASWAEQKIGDIRALDDIAKKAAQKGKGDFSYRPQTFIGTGKCTLFEPSGDKAVLKRTHSCGAGHVKIVDAAVRTSLKCIDPSKSLADGPQPPKTGERFWFHQEYVDSLVTLASFE